MPRAASLLGELWRAAVCRHLEAQAAEAVSAWLHSASEVSKVLFLSVCCNDGHVHKLTDTWLSSHAPRLIGLGASIHRIRTKVKSKTLCYSCSTWLPKQELEIPLSTTLAYLIPLLTQIGCTGFVSYGCVGWDSLIPANTSLHRQCTDNSHYCAELEMCTVHEIKKGSSAFCCFLAESILSWVDAVCARPARRDVANKMINDAAELVQSSLLASIEELWFLCKTT